MSKVQFNKIFTGAALFLALCVGFGVQSLHAAGSELFGGITFSTGFPQGDFKENLGGNGFGVGINFGADVGHSPFSVGVDLNILNYGEDKRLTYIDGVPELPLYVVHRYNMLQGLGFLRLQPVKRGPVRPYVEFLAGMNYLWAETSLEDDHHWNDDGDYSTTSFDDTAFCYGFGGGLLFRIGGSRSQRRGHHGVEFLFDIRARFLFGGEAKYLDEGSIKSGAGNNVEIYYYESKTDLLNLQAGLGIRF